MFSIRLTVSTTAKILKVVTSVRVPPDFYSIQMAFHVETWTSVLLVRTSANRIVSIQREATNVRAKKVTIKLEIIAKVGNSCILMINFLHIS